MAKQKSAIDLPTPWLDESGEILSDSLLKVLSRTWDLGTWDRFLARTVEKEISRNEVVADDYQDLLEDEVETIWDGQKNLPAEVNKEIHQAIRSLKPTSKAVIKGVYFKEYSQRKVGELLGLSPSSVNQFKKISLSNIKSFLDLAPNTAAYLIGGSQKFASPILSQQDEIRAAYAMDLCGGYIK